MAGVALCLLLFFLNAASAADQELMEAVGLYHHGDYQRAHDILSRKSASQNQAEVHFWLGKSSLKLHKRDEAIRELQEAVRLDPPNGSFHRWLGRAYGDKASHVSFLSASGWARKVAQEFETAVKLTPHDIDARLDLLQFYLKAPGMVGGGRDKAVAQVREIVAIDPIRGYQARAMAYEQDKKWVEARDQLTEATSRFPDNAVAFTNLADFLLDQRDYVGAESSARKAQGLAPGNINARFIQSAASVGLKRDLPSAQKSLLELTAGFLSDSDPGFEDVYYWLGRAYQEEGMAAEAREAFRAALRYDPEYKAAKTALSQIKP